MIASFLAVDGMGSKALKGEPTGDPLAAVMAAVLVYEIAAERLDAKGPGSFLTGFLDALYQLRQRVLHSDIEFGKLANIKSIQITA